MDSNNNFHTKLAKQKACKVIVQYLGERSEDFEIFKGSIETAYAEDNTPNAKGDCVKRLCYQEVENALNKLFTKFAGISFY